MWQGIVKEVQERVIIRVISTIEQIVQNTTTSQITIETIIDSITSQNIETILNQKLRMITR